MNQKDYKKEYKKRWHIKNRDKVIKNVEQWRIDNPERSAKIDRTTSKRYGKKHPEKIKAHNEVTNAIRKGILPKPNSFKCSYCFNLAKEYHHYKGYDEENWLEVKPICINCHHGRGDILVF